MRILKFFLKLFLYLALAVLLVFGGIIVYDTVTDYKPTQKEKLTVKGGGFYNIPLNSVITILSWNMGYCGLGEDMDFFYDGGKRVRATPEEFQKYLNGSLNFLSKHDSVSIFLLQEVDTNAKRTYYLNESILINQFLSSYSSVFAKNYDVRFVPFPVYNPMGSVVSGIMTLSKAKPVEAFRVPYLSHFSWPKNIFLLDRCLICSRYKMQGGKYLVVLNTHNSAYDDAAKLREEESEIIRTTMLEEYDKGNYVIVGGDWNRNPPGFNFHKFKKGYAGRTIEPALDSSFLPVGWKWVYDPSIPSNRDVNEPYKEGKTKTTIIDYFIVSPNLQVVENKTIETDFMYSDHQPIYIKIRAKLPDTISRVKIKKEEEPKKVIKKKIIKKVIKKKAGKDSTNSSVAA
jgi:endonuclease/exonuclease/phosphatase family metal-dependent hydrolase